MKNRHNCILAWASPLKLLLPLVAIASAFLASNLVEAQSNGVEPALEFDEIGDEIFVDGGMAVAAGADVEFSAWIFPISWEGNNPGLWRSGGNFNIFQGASGRPWIRWNGADILRPTEGYSVPLGQWTQVKYVVRSQSVAEFWTRGAGEEWVLRHAANHNIQTPEFLISYYGWQANRNERVRGIHNDIQFRQNGALFCHWELDEGSGTVATDSSGNGNDGAIVGAQWVDTTGRPPVMPVSSMPFAYDFGTVRFLRVLSEHTGGTYELGVAAAGERPFTDEQETIVSLPAELEGNVMIRTANAHSQWQLEDTDSIVWTFVNAIPDKDANGTDLPGANTTLADGSGPFQPLASTARATDWTYRNFGNDWILHSLGLVDTPPDTKELVTTVSGLVPGSVHPVYAMFWSDSSPWGVRAGLQYGNDARENPWYDKTSEAVALASDLGPWETDPLFVQSSRRLYAALVGNATADSTGKIPVYIHDLPTVNAATRSWYDGVAVASGVPRGSGNYLAFEVDRDVTLTIANDPSSEPEWLTSGFSKTALTIQTTAGNFDVWQKQLGAREQVMLPGNVGAPGDNNYWVLLSESPDVITDSQDENFHRSPVLDWGLRNYSWQAATNPDHGPHATTMVTEVPNLSPANGFNLTAHARVPRLQNAGDNSYGLVLLGDGAGYIHAEWLPRIDGGGSTIRLVDSATGITLAETPWAGMTPTRVNNDVGLTGQSEATFEAGSPYFAGESLLLEDFENGAGNWTSGGTENNWEVGPPASGPGTAVSGQNVAATGLNEPYRAWTDSWFRSPVIDLTDVASARLSFWEYTEVDTDIDYHHTIVSIVDADTFVQIEELSRNADQTNGWRLREFALSSASLGKRVRLQFNLKSDDKFLGGDGWFIDDVAVRSDTGLVITKIPEHLDPEGRLSGINTEMNDVGNTSDTYLQFTVTDNAPADGNAGVAVYVAWDIRNSGFEPDWLTQNFLRTDHFVGVSSDAGYHRLWARDYASGEQVTLGGASATGAGPFLPGTHNYFVLLGDTRAGLESVYTLSASGVYQNDAWDLSFTLTDAAGVSASVAATLADPRQGRREFGVAARHTYATDGLDVSSPIWETFSLAMDYVAAPDFVTFDDWRQQHFTSTELADSSVSGADAAPAGDGVANLVKYALRLAPKVPVASKDLPQVDLDSEGRLTLTYWERTDVNDIAYVPEVSEDLEMWQSGDGHVVETFRGPLGNDLEEVEVRAELAAEAARGFIRLRIEQIQ